MFGRYDCKSHSTDDNDTESWSFPSNYERFSTVNVPKSRLGKRRNIDASSEVKRDVLKGLSTVTTSSARGGNTDFSRNSYSQGTSLTHPVNTSLTPHKISNLNSLLSKCNQESKGDYERNSGCSTPFRKENSQPLQEIKNFLNVQKLHCATGKLASKAVFDQRVENVSSEIDKVLNKSFEATEGITNDVAPYYGSVPFAETHPDSTHSDIGNNSSFITAHDIYNVEKTKVQYDSLNVRTPRKGFSLLDMLASPVDPVGTVSLSIDNDNFKKVLSQTPGFSNFESFKTPFKSQAKLERFANEMFTPTLLNNARTPMIRSNHLLSLPDTDLKSEESETVSKISPSDATKGGNLSMSDNKQSLADSNTFFKTTPPSEENGTYHLSECSELPKPSPSFETKVKRQILEGLGWSLPPSSFSSPGMKSPLFQPKEKFNMMTNSVLLTPNNSVADASKCISECKINASEMEVDFVSSNITNHSHCDITSECSVLTRDIKTDTVLVPSIDKKETDEVPDGHEINSPENTRLAYIAPKTDSESKTVETNITGLNISSAPESNSSLDVGFSNAIDLHSSKNEPQSVIPMETSSSIISKDMGLYNEETEMVTVQNVPVIEQETMKEVPAIVQPHNNVEVKNINTLSKTPSESIDKKTELNSCSQKTKITNDTSNQQKPLQPFTLSCPRQIIKPESNVVYVNKKPYTVLSMLGRGGSSEVYQVLDTESSKLMAMKFVNLASVEESIATGYLNEIEVLTKLQGCPSVIRMFDSEYIPESKILYVVMEKGDTDFSRLMKDIMKTKKISISMIIYYWTEMLSCVKDIHEKGIIHSDLKPANFLLVSGRLKLIDFGIASSLQGDMTSVLKDVTTGTFNYMSPEAIRNCGDTRGYKITYKSDIWSLGCILYNLLYGRTPFSHLTNTWAKLGAIANPETSVTFPSDSSPPPHLLFSVRWALRKDPKERPTAGELLKLAELTPGPESKLGRQISSLLAEYISQTFPNCSIKLETENSIKKNNIHS